MPRRIGLDDYLEYVNGGVQNTSNFAQTSRQWKTIEKDTFVDCLNELSEFLFTTKGNLNTYKVFKNVVGQPQPQHVRHTLHKPSIVAAFRDDWQYDNRVYAWPQIQLAGEIATFEEDSIDSPKHLTARYLNYMILTQPDLFVVRGLAVEDTSVTFLAGITGQSVVEFELDFNDGRLRPLLYALIDHIYDPGEFKDNRYEMTFNEQSQECEYTLLVETKAGEAQRCPNFRLTYASDAFQTATYVVSTSNPVVMANSPLRIVKEQYCRVTLFSEAEIFRHVHKEEDVPGVVTLIRDEEWGIPIPSNHRVKRRLGFSQYGDPFMSISTLRHMLEAVYDVLEVTRYLRLKHQILHRNLNVGNIIVMAPKAASKRGDNESVKHGPHKESDMCFIKHLLGESDNPRETSVIIIDFNRAERLDVRTDAEHAPIGQTGEPLFIARAIQKKGPFPDLKGYHPTYFPAMPTAPQTYKECHPERAKIFDGIEEFSMRGPDAILANRAFRHELYHDAESIFWIIFYWLTLANPDHADTSNKVIGSFWMFFRDTEDVEQRDLLLHGLKSKIGSKVIHSKLSFAFPLLSTLAEAVYPGPYFLADDSPRTRPEFVHEVFQREILNFVIANKDEEFMDLNVMSSPRTL